jgi:hypothetical protein
MANVEIVKRMGDKLDCDSVIEVRVARFFLTQYTKTRENRCTCTKLPQHYQMAINYTKWQYNIPNGSIIFQMAV